MPFSLTDHQLELVMTAAEPLDPSKRATLMERIAVHLRLTGVRYPTDHDVDRAIKWLWPGCCRDQLPDLIGTGSPRQKRSIRHPRLFIFKREKIEREEESL